jgi:FkbM family methyltransferase
MADKRGVDANMRLMSSAIMSYRRQRDRVRWRIPQRFDGFVLCGCPRQQDWEAEERAAITQCLSDVDTCVDVGANVGFYTCFFRSRGKRTIAFEPLRRNLNFLYHNLEANGFTDVEVFPVALGERASIQRIHGVEDVASLIPDWSRTAPHHSEIVSVMTLDDALGARLDGRRALIKIDVEGAELQLLHGASRTLGEGHIWLVEVLERNCLTGAMNESFQATINLFANYGYNPLRVGYSYLLR